MSELSVYLAGPITNKTIAEANDWRTPVIQKLAQYGIRGISPLRCEPARGERYTISNADPLFGTTRAIRSKNLFDVRYCTWTLAYMPKHLNDPRPSTGTIAELAAAAALGKTTILVSDDPSLTGHPVMRWAAGWILDDLDSACEVIIGVLKDYA